MIGLVCICLVRDTNGMEGENEYSHHPPSLRLAGWGRKRRLMKADVWIPVVSIAERMWHVVCPEVWMMGRKGRGVICMEQSKVVC